MVHNSLMEVKLKHVANQLAEMTLSLALIIIARVANKSNKTSYTQKPLLHTTKPGVPNANIELN